MFGGSDGMSTSIPWKPLLIHSCLSAYHGKPSRFTPAFQHTMETPLDPLLPFSIPWEPLWIHSCLPWKPLWIHSCLSAYHGNPSGSTPAFQHTMENPLDPLLPFSIPCKPLWIHSCLSAYHGNPSGSSPAYHGNPSGSTPAFQHTMETPLDPLLPFSIPWKTLWIHSCFSAYHGKPSGSTPAFQHTM